LMDHGFFLNNGLLVNDHSNHASDSNWHNVDNEE